MNWIKCENQLPRMDDLVQVCNPDDDNWGVTVGELVSTGWRVLNSLGTTESTDYVPLKTFTHWMPLANKPTK